MEQNLYICRNNNILIMDLHAEIKWIQNALLESKDPTFVEAIKNMIKSMRKVKETLSSEQLREDALIAEAEEDIKAGEVYSINEAHKIVDNWNL